MALLHAARDDAAAPPPIQSPLAPPPEPGFKPSMHGFGALLITLSCLSPSIGVFIVGSDVMHQAGTAVFACFAAAVLLGLAMAAVYGELASAFPDSGGEYTILGRALGPPWGVAALANNLVGFSIAQSLSGLGVASYLAAAFPGLPAIPVAALLVALVTGMAILNIRVGAAITGGFFAIELLTLVVLAGLGLVHPHRSLAATVLHPVMASPGGALMPVALAVAGAAAAGGIYAFNGYGSVVFLGEELHEAPRRIAGVVFLALGVAALTELVPVAALLTGAPDLHAMLAAPSPVQAFIAATSTPWIGRMMNLGVAAAIFNCMIAVALMAGRQLYSTGRDRLWPAPVSRQLARLHPRLGSPWVATLVMGAAGLVGCFVDPKLLVLVLGNGNVALYAGLALACLIGRRSGATSGCGFRMPLFPLPPLLALAALAAVVWFDLHDASGAQGLAASAVVIALALAYHRLVLRRHAAWAHAPGPASKQG
jgi:amino acid transporter